MSDKLEVTEEEKVLERIVRNNLEIARLQEENDTLKAYYKNNDAYPAGTKKELGKFYIRISSNQRIDNSLAVANLPASLVSRISKKVVDSALAKKVLGSNDLAKITKTYDNKIEVGLR